MQAFRTPPSRMTSSVSNVSVANTSLAKGCAESIQAIYNQYINLGCVGRVDCGDEILLHRIGMIDMTHFTLTLVIRHSNIVLVCFGFGRLEEMREGHQEH